jgi:NAD-dependent SIR2 family protein deacetylase
MEDIKAKKIAQAQLLLAVSDANKNGSSVRYGFILGAGASVASGIPSGHKLATKWYEEIEESIGEDELKSWTDSIDGFDKENIAASYTKIFKKRFEVDYHLGYQELQRHMDNYSFDKGDNELIGASIDDILRENDGIPTSVFSENPLAKIKKPIKIKF